VTKSPVGHELYRVLLTNCRLMIGQDMLLTNQTRAIQSIADKLPAHDWSRYVTNQSDTSYT